MIHATPRLRSVPVSACALLLAVFSVAATGSTAATPGSAAAAPRARTTSGWVQGNPGPVLSFKGIPYATPPVGRLRWRAPEPARAWTGVRDATHFGHDCMQTPFVVPTGQDTSEDCLTVNVWTPAMRPAGAGLPVMVWIYGGGFIGGSAAYPLYDPTRLAARGVVVVSFNYRVGVFGFLAHPGLSAENPRHISGNYGLLDQIAALKWVQRNASAFGGDPARVTVFGESAGAVSIAFLLTSPLAHGLFAQAIMQSPGLVPLPSLAAAEKASAARQPDINVLRRMSAADLLAHTGDFATPVPHQVMSLGTPQPVVDGHLLPVEPRTAYRNGQVTRIPAIVGMNAQEGAMFSQVKNSAQLHEWAHEVFGAQAATLLPLYPATDDQSAAAAAADLLGDALLTEGARQIARGLSTGTPPVYAYVFDRRVGGAPGHATHSEDMAFVFGTLDAPSFIPHGAPDAIDRHLSDLMQAAWVNFASKGDPDTTGLPVWPRYDSSDPYLELSASSHTGTGFRKVQLDAIAALYGH